MSGDVRTGADERLGPYRLMTRIGEGGMGVVHLGLDPAGRAVAIKVLRPQVAAAGDARARLAREVETMRRVASPHVARVLDADVHGERPYIVTSYVRGRSLEEVVRDEGPLTGEALARLAGGLADALSAIHASGVVHRDLKPSNVLLVEGEPVVIDFGIAHAADVTRLTQTGLFIGTPGYLAPEAIDGEPIGPAADVHAWGATVAFAATGRPPFGTGSFEVVFYNITRGRADIADVPEPFSGPVRAALARDPESRPTTARLREWADGLTGRGAVSTAPPDGQEPASTVRLGDGASAPTARLGAVPAGTYVDTRERAQGASPTRPYTGLAPTPTRPVVPPVPVGVPPAAPPPYPPPRSPGQPPAGAAPAPPSHAPGTRARHPTLAALLLAILIGCVAVAPYAGVVAVVVLLFALRTADGVLTGLAARRDRRGPSAFDAVLGAIGLPWHLARAALVTCLTLPIAVVAGLLMGGVVLVLEHPYAVAGDVVAFGAGAFALVSFFGPGGGAPRRRAGRMLGALPGGHSGAVVAGFVLSAVLLVVLAAVGSRATLWWPVGPPDLSLSGLLPGLPSLPDLPHLPNLPHLPGLHGLPHLPALPHLPGLSHLPQLPNLPGPFG